MKKTILIILSLSLSYLLSAQETVKQKEVGLSFTGLNSFGLTFKTGTEKSMWRLNSLIASGSSQTITFSDSTETKRSSSSFGIAAGKELRKKIADNLELRFGADVNFTYNQTKNTIDDSSINNRSNTSKINTYNPGINLVFGFNYIIKDHLIVGAELLPIFSYTTGKVTQLFSDNEESTSDVSGFNYGLSNSSASLSLSYRF